MLCSFLFFVQKGSAQVQTARYVTTSFSNGYYEYLPQGYDPAGTQTYPLLLFIHGMGELGDGSPAKLPLVLRNGPPKLINQGKFPTSFTVNGVTHRFIVISPQFIDWPSTTNINEIVDYLIRTYKINTSRIYVTGLSMGGGVTWEYAGDDVHPAFGKRVAAIVPVAGASWPDITRSQTMAQNNLAVWATHNDQDPTVPSSYTIDYVNNINSFNPNPRARMTIFSSTSHDAWTKTYDPNYRENGLNVYEWMLQYQKGSTPPSNAAPVARAGNDVNLTLPANSVQVSGSGSTDADGTITGYNWARISGPTQFTISSASVVNPTISNLVAGTYVFRLTVTDNQGATSTDDISINVASVPTPPPPGTTKYIKVNIYGGSNPYNNSEWNNWNISTSTNINSGSLKYSDGTSSSVTTVLSSNETVADNEASYTGGMAPAEVLRYTSYSGAQRTLIFSGLTAARTYSLELYASRAINANESTIYTAGSASSTVASYNNHTTKGLLSNLVADAQGRITVTIQSGQTYNYLNGFILTDANTVPGSNSPPTVNAGADQSITLPASSVTLSGSAADSDGNITSLVWSKVLGPASGTITNPTQAQTTVTNLVQGSYTFELRATDNGGAVKRDSVIVVVNPASGITKYIKVNVYGGANPYNNSEWNNWNVATSTSNISSGTLKYSDGTASSASAVLSISEAVADNEASYAGGMAPAEVLRYASYSGMQRTLTFSGLVASRSYNFEFYSSRYMNVDETTIYSSGSATTTVASYDNHNTKGLLQNLVADAQGRIVVTIRSGRTYNYLNGFILTEGGGTSARSSLVEPVAIERNISDPVASVYPNPVNDRFVLLLKNNFTGPVKIQVVSTSGSVVKTFSLNKTQLSTQNSFSVAGLPAGAYTVVIQSGDSRRSVKMLKL